MKPPIAPALPAVSRRQQAVQAEPLPLQPAGADEARAALAQLFAGYPEPWAERGARHASALTEARVNAYLLAVDGIPGWAVTRAVAAFIRGQVERRRRDRLPTAEEVAVEARAHVQAEASRQARRRQLEQEQAERRQWAARQAWLKTPEGREHLQERARRAAAILARHGWRWASPETPPDAPLGSRTGKTLAHDSTGDGS